MVPDSLSPYVIESCVVARLIPVGMAFIRRALQLRLPGSGVSPIFVPLRRFERCLTGSVRSWLPLDAGTTTSASKIFSLAIWD